MSAQTHPSIKVYAPASDSPHPLGELRIITAVDDHVGSFTAESYLIWTQPMGSVTGTHLTCNKPTSLPAHLGVIDEAFMTREAFEQGKIMLIEAVAALPMEQQSAAFSNAYRFEELGQSQWISALVSNRMVIPSPISAMPPLLRLMPVMPL